MPFKLSRAGNNVPAEVQRWQYFLLTKNIPQTGEIDADFGPKTEQGTKIFQMQQQLPTHGRVDDRTLEVAAELGYNILPDNYYDERESLDFPPRPNDLDSPDNAWRNSRFQCFQFRQRPLNQRPSPESIIIKGSCDGATSDWTQSNIIDFESSKFQFARGYRGTIRSHKRAKDQIEELLSIWEAESLLHLVISYAGCFVARYIRGEAPGSSGHGLKRSDQVSKLSNHSFGSAFDINARENWRGETPARCGQRGSVRELVEAANNLGFFWGGHYAGTKDGMHFEISKAVD